MEKSISQFSVVSSLFFRLSAAAAKFILFIYLARNISPEDLGLLGIIIAILIIAVQMTGMELHYVNSRNIAAQEMKNVAPIIKAQFSTHFLSYILALPCLAIVFYFEILDWSYLLSLSALLIFEHLSQEMVRFLQFTFNPVKSAFLIFLRSGVWVFILIILCEFYSFELTVKLVLNLWLIFSIFASIYGAFSLRKFLFKKTEIKLFSLTWLREVLIRSMPFFLTTTCFTLSQFIDRFVLNNIIGGFGVGIFFFMASMASALNLFVSFSVGVFYGPLAIRAFRKDGLQEFKSVKRVFIKKSIIFGCIGLICALMFIHPALYFIDSKEYYNYVNIYYLMLFANCIMVASDFSNLEMYVRGLDIEMMSSAIVGLVMTFIIQVSFISLWGMNGIGFAVILSVATTWLIRHLFFKRAIRLNPDLLFSQR